MANETESNDADTADDEQTRCSSHCSTADPWPADMWRAMFWMLVNAAADSPFCHCGEEPFTRGEQCPTCVAITLKESLRPHVSP